VVLGVQPDISGDTCQGVGRIAVQASVSGNAVGNMVTGFKVRGGWSENSHEVRSGERASPKSHTGQRATTNGIGTAPTPGRMQRKTSCWNGGTSIPAIPLRS
jgi:hypothetical protein